MTEESNDTKVCPFCAETIKAAAIVCKHCGRDLPAGAEAAEASEPAAPVNTGENLPWWPMTLVSAVILGAIWFASSKLPSSTAPTNDKQRERSGIELCWQDYARKSLDPETKRFIAGACEMKEREFVTKYGVKP